jgi:hypothetical protein
MHMLSEKFIWLAIAITIFGDIFYLRDTLAGKTKPNRVTFFLWGAAPLVAYFAQRTEHGGPQIGYTLLIAVVPLIILSASFVNKQAYWALSAFDLTCGILSVIALIFLVVSNNGFIALIISIVADFFAALPTIIKSYHYPETETTITYVLEVIGSVLVLLTIKHFIFIDYSFAAYVLLLNMSIGYLLLRPHPKHSVKAPSKVN